MNKGDEDQMTGEIKMKGLSPTLNKEYVLKLKLLTVIVALDDRLMKGWGVLFWKSLISHRIHQTVSVIVRKIDC